MLTNLIGRRYGSLKVIGKSTPQKSHARWVCKCDCGRRVIVFNTNIIRGLSTQCSPCGWKASGDKVRVHGRANYGKKKADKAYAAWSKMKRRCYSKNSPDYYLYGARGIEVCKRWKNSFPNFLSDMGDPPTKKHSLDRYPNNDTGNYEPGNCRWANDFEQANNKRNNRKVMFNGKPMPMSEASRLTGIKYATIRSLSALRNATVEQMVEFYAKKTFKNQKYTDVMK